MAKRVDTNVFIRARDATKAGLVSAQKSFKRFTKKMSRHMDTVTKASKVAGAGMSAAFIGATASIKEATSALDGIAKQARSLSIDSDLFQSLAVYSEDVGTSVDALANTIKKLEKSASEAATGTAQYLDAYERLGVSVYDANGKVKQGIELIDSMADTYAKAADKTKLLGDMARVGGRNVHELTLILSSGKGSIAEYAEAAKAGGAVVDKEILTKAEVVESKLGKLGAQAKNAWRSNWVQMADDYGTALNHFGGMLGAFALDTGSALSVMFDPFSQKVHEIINWFEDQQSKNDIRYVREHLKSNQARIDAAKELIVLSHKNNEKTFIFEGTQYRITEWQMVINKLARERAQLLQAEKNYTADIAQNRQDEANAAQGEREQQLKFVKNYKDSFDFVKASEEGDPGEAADAQVKAAEAVTKAEKDKQDTVLRGIGIANQATTALTAIAGEEFENNKKTQIAMGLANTAAAAITAMRTDAQWGGPWAIASGSLVAAAGLAQVAAIRNTSIGGGASALPTGSAAPAPIQETRINSNINVFASGVGRENSDQIGREVASELHREFNR